MAVVLMSPARRTGVAEFYGHRNKFGTGLSRGGIFFPAYGVACALRLQAP